MAEIRDGKAAVANATRACELAEWKNGSWLDTLAAAFAESGDFEKAAMYEKQALAIVAGAKTTAMQARLVLYEKNQPYREPTE